MEFLDLARHNPKEYEGKLVAWRGCEYIVGVYVGSVAERIVHKLINRASGLCLHVLEIGRRADLGYVSSRVQAVLALRRTPESDFAKIIPISIAVELPGGWAEMQIRER